MSQAVESSTSKTRRVGYWLIHTAIILAAIIGAAGNIIQGIAHTIGRPVWNLGEAPLPPLSLARLPIFLQAELREGASGSVLEADLVLRLLNIVPQFLEALTVLVAAWLLLRVLRKVAAREAFTATAITRWRALAITLLAGGLITGLINTATFIYVTWHVSGLWTDDPLLGEDRIDFLGGDYMALGVAPPYWPVSLIVAGLVALALTAAFRAGAQLERDVDGVI